MSISAKTWTRVASILPTSATGKRLPLIHPGEIPREDFLSPMKISVYTLAQAIKVPRSRVNDIVLGRRNVSADTAFVSLAIFGTTPGFLDQPTSSLRAGEG